MGKMESFAKTTADVGRRTVEGAKVLTSKIAEKVVDGVGSMKDRAVDTIQLHTTEKWAMLTGRGTENWVSSRNDSNIMKVTGKIESVQSRISLQNDSFAIERQKHEDSIAKYGKDSAIGMAFQKELDVKIKSHEAEIEKIKTKSKFDELVGKKEENLVAKAEHEKKVKAIEEKYTYRIDGRINGIKEKYKYDEKVEEQANLTKHIDENENKLKFTQEKLADWQGLRFHKLPFSQARSEINANIKETEKEIKIYKKEIAEAKNQK